MAAAPLAKVAVNTAESSLVTASFSSDSSAWSWPITLPRGRLRSLMEIVKSAPATETMGPAMYSARSMMWAPRSASAPLPRSPRNRQLIGPAGSQA